MFWRNRPIVGYIFLLVGVVAIAFIFQNRQSEVQRISAQNRDSIHQLQIVTRQQKDDEKNAKAAQKQTDQRILYSTCLSNQRTWVIADSFILYETSPGQERSTLLGLLDARPVCHKPRS